MLSASPPRAASGFGALSHEERQTALAALLVAQHDVVLNGAYDHGEEERQNGGASSSSAPSTPHQSSSLDCLTPTSPSSSLSSRSVSPAPPSSLGLSSSLLIRSKCQGWERSFELHADWPVPRIEREDEVLIRHCSVGLNPVDFKSVLYNFGIPESPWVLGRDIAGVVSEVGAKVTHLKPGQRVWTCADSRDVRAGAYQAFSVARAVHVGHVCANLKDEQAATLGTGLVTAAIAAYWFFRWPRATELGGGKMPRSKSGPGDDVDTATQEKPWVLIYGGGAITGIYLAQLAQLSGFRTIAIASPSNFSYLTSDQVGVTRCVDRYLSPEEIGRQVHEITCPDGGIRYVLDCVGAKTAALCYDLAANPAVENASPLPPAEMICLAGDPKSPAPGRCPVQTHKISFSTTFYGDDVFARQVVEDLDALMQTGKLNAVRFEVVPDGLAGVRNGLERLRDNQAPRACKLVVNVDETPNAHLTNLGVRAELGWNGAV